LISSHSYDLTVSFYNLLLIVPLVLTHEEFAKHFRRFLGIRRKGWASNQACGTTGGANGPTTAMARNALGENIIVSNDPSKYFQVL